MIDALVERDPQALPASEAVLYRLLDEHLSPEYGQGLTTHLPMALHALQALGGSEAQLLAFRGHYVRRYAGQMAAQAAPAADWRALLGVGGEESHAALAAGFAADLVREGGAALLHRLLPELLPGLAAGAFHGVIRVAHAVQAGHDGELAQGLAYWAWRWQTMPALQAPASLMDFNEWSRQLVDEAAGQIFAAPLISERIALAGASSTYVRLGAALAPQPRLLERLAGLSLSLYLRTRNLTALHLITGLHALRVLLPFVADPSSLQPELLPAFTAAFVASQRQMPIPMPPALDWQAAKAAACNARDDHAIKLVHACVEEFATYGDARYLDAARLALA